MARLTLVYACLLATMLVAGAMPSSADIQEPGPGLPDVPVPAAVADLAGYGPSCSKSDDDAGMGGTHVSCKYSCAANNLLAIGGHAADPDAKAYGDTSCGGASAICRTVQNECAGASDGVTSQAQAKATCHGASDEWWDSPMTIACASHGTDPEAIVCQLTGVGCDGEDPYTLGVPPLDDEIISLAELEALCRAVVSKAEDVVASKTEEFVSFVLALLGPQQFSVVTFDPQWGCQASSGLY